MPYQEDGTEWAKRLKIGRLVSDVFVFLLPASLLAAIVATHINPVVTPGFTEPQRVLESSAGFIILPPVVMASLIALYIECLAEPAVAHIIARGRTSASKASWGQSRTLAMFGRGLLLSATTASTVALLWFPGPDGHYTNRLIKGIGVAAPLLPLLTCFVGVFMVGDGFAKYYGRQRWAATLVKSAASVGAAIAGMVAWSFLAMHAALSMPIQLTLLAPFDDIAYDADCTNATAFAELFAAIDCSTTPNCGYRDWRDACRAVILTPYVIDLLAANVSIVWTTYVFVLFRPLTLLPEFRGSKDWILYSKWLFFYVPSSPVQCVIALYLAVNGLPAIFALLSPVPPPRFVAPPLTCHGSCIMWLLRAYLIVLLAGILWPSWVALGKFYRYSISKTRKIHHADDTMRLAQEQARRAAKDTLKTLAKLEQDLNGDAESWGAVPSASTPCKPPSEWSAAAPLAELLKAVQADEASLATVYAKGERLARQMFAKVVPLIASSDEAQRLLLDMFEKRKRGSLEQYRAILTRTRRDPTFPEFKSVSQGLQEKLKARVGECVQKKPSRGGALDFAMLRAQAGRLKPDFDDFVEAVATKCGAKHSTPPLKGAWRAIEKMALRTESEEGECGALKEGPLDATSLCDVLRGSLQCEDFTMLVTALDLLKALDSEFGDLAQARGLTQRIRLLRIKDRFATPTSGGWADVLVNFVFEEDAAKHVVELQLQHKSLLLVRKEGGGHKDYNEFRSAFELLEAVGKAPTDAFEDATGAEFDAVVNQEWLNQELRSLRELLEKQQAKIDEQGRQIAASLEARLKRLEDALQRPLALGEFEEFEDN